MDTDLICKNLQSLERSDRQKTLKDLLKYCEDEKISTNDLIEIYDKCYLHILKCYSDRFENCRELSCNLMTEFIKKLPKNDYYLQYVINTISLRIGQKELQEKSEEIRLIYLKQLYFLIDKYKSDDIIGDPLLKSYNEIINIFLKTLTDSYPAVQRKTCECILLLAKSTPSFHYRAEILTKPLYSILHHKHSANRIAAIQSLGIICLNILTNPECIKQIITEISPLVMDSQPLVRKECGNVGCLWLMELKDRYSFFERILPIVICCLNDDSPEVREHIEKLWLKCGQQYFEENQNELDKIEIIDKIPLNYPENVKRPTIGCRALCQRSLKLIKSIMWETSDWKEEVRLHSLKLLWQIVLHSEEKLTGKFMDIFPDLCRACEDSDSNVSKMAIKVSDLMGRLMIYDEWFELGLEYFEQHPKLGCIKCFYFLYLGSNNNNGKDILSIAKILAKKEFSNTLKVENQKYLLKFVDILWQRYKQKSFKENTEEPIEKALEKMKLENENETEKYIYHTLIKIMALSFNDIDKENDIQQEGHVIFEKLSDNNDCLILELHKSYLNSVIETFDSLDSELDEFSEPILLLYGIIRICGFHKTYLESLKKCIQIVWENAESSGKVKIFSAISISMLKWNTTMFEGKDENIKIEEYEENIQILRKFLKDIVEPHLIWKAGANAESMRTIATATLCSMTQGAIKQSLKILPEYASYFQNLIEDNNLTTRIYALRCLNNFGIMKFEFLRGIAYAVLQRLDDPSAEVRMWAARVLCKFDTSELTEDESKIWISFIKQALKMLFLHFEGPEIKLKNIIRDTIIGIGKQYPELFNEAYTRALSLCANKDELNEIQKLVKI